MWSPAPCRRAAIQVLVDPAPPRSKPQKPVVHENKMKGKRAPHRLRNLAKELGLPRTAEGYSAANVYSPRTADVPVDADVSQLSRALQKYWQMEGIDGGVYPADATIITGSRIKLWAHKTHRDIGDAIGHPCLDGRRRYGGARVPGWPGESQVDAWKPANHGSTCPRRRVLTASCQLFIGRRVFASRRPVNQYLYT